MTIQKAAHHRSVSERTIFRRVERGGLGKRSHHDGHAEVWAPLSAGPAPAGQCPDVDSDSVGHERALILVDRLGGAVSRQLAPALAALSASEASGMAASVTFSVEGTVGPPMTF